MQPTQNEIATVAGVRPHQLPDLRHRRKPTAITHHTCTTTAGALTRKLTELLAQVDLLVQERDALAAGYDELFDQFIQFHPPNATPPTTQPYVAQDDDFGPGDPEPEWDEADQPDQPRPATAKQIDFYLQLCRQHHLDRLSDDELMTMSTNELASAIDEILDNHGTRTVTQPDAAPTDRQIAYYNRLCLQAGIAPTPEAEIRQEWNRAQLSDAIQALQNQAA